MDSKKLNKLREDIDRFKKDKLYLSKDERPTKNNINAFTIAIELVAGTIVGLITGIFFDRMLNSKPLFLIICLSLGIIATIKTIWQKIK